MGVNWGNFFESVGLGIVGKAVRDTTGINANYAGQDVAMFGNNTMATDGNTGYNMSAGSFNYGNRGFNYSNIGASSYRGNNSLFGNGFASSSMYYGNSNADMMGKSISNCSLSNFAAMIGQICG